MDIENIIAGYVKWKDLHKGELLEYEEREKWQIYNTPALRQQIEKLKSLQIPKEPAPDSQLNTTPPELKERQQELNDMIWVIKPVFCSTSFNVYQACLDVGQDVFYLVSEIPLEKKEFHHLKAATWKNGRGILLYRLKKVPFSNEFYGKVMDTDLDIFYIDSIEKEKGAE